MSKLKKDSQGFTIIELTIATLVFSVILVVIISSALSFSKSYYKNLNASTTQNTVRSISDTISQTIKFSGTPVESHIASGTGLSYFCAGGYVFSYSLGEKYENNSSNRGLYMQRVDGNCSAPSPGAPSGGNQLLATNMRIASFKLSNAADPNVWTTSIRIAYGDSDDFEGGIGSGAIVYGDNLKCKSQEGSQYCSTASVTSSVQKRVINQ